MKKIVFLVLILILFGGLYLVLRTPKTHFTLPDKKTDKPLVYLADKNEVLMIPTAPQLNLKLKTNIPSLKLKEKNDFLSGKSDETSSLKPVFDYVSIGKCNENELAPDYLANKFANTSKTGNKTRSSCGFIHTKIPFQF